MKRKYVLRIARKNFRETIVQEIFDGSYRQAEARLGELWNQHAAFDGNRRFRGTLNEYGSRHILQSIE